MAKKYTLGEIAEFLAAKLRGDVSYTVDAIAPLNNATANQISFFAKVSGFAAAPHQHLSTTNAGAVILSPKDAKDYRGNALIVEDPYVGYAKATSLFCQLPPQKPGIHLQTVLGQDSNIHDSVSIAANCTIGNNVHIGANSVITAGCVIADNTQIGADCYLYPNVSVYHNAYIGNRVTIHSGAIIGADGFGMANDKGVWRKIFQLGGVHIGDDVEIGANTCIDRGALEDTVIEEGVKLDNLIQIAHNVTIGAHTIIAGCTAIAGGVKIGKHCMIGGASTVNGHIEIADQVIITGDSTVLKSIAEPGIYSSGLTVQPHRAWVKTISRLLQLDELIKKLPKKLLTRK